MDIPLDGLSQGLRDFAALRTPPTEALDPSKEYLDAFTNEMPLGAGKIGLAREMSNRSPGFDNRRGLGA